MTRQAALPAAYQIANQLTEQARLAVAVGPHAAPTVTALRECYSLGLFEVADDLVVGDVVVADRHLALTDLGWEVAMILSNLDVPLVPSDQCRSCFKPATRIHNRPSYGDVTFEPSRFGTCDAHSPDWATQH